MKTKTNAVNTVTAATATATATATAAVEQVQLLAHELLLLGTNANQEAFATVVTGKSIADLVAVDSYGGRISGSAERALAALLNTVMPFDWFNVEHRDNTADAKALKPFKTQCFAAWQNASHSNPSTKYARTRAYASELRNPAKVTGEVVEEGREASEATAGATSRTRDLYARSVVEIGKLFRALNSTENDEAIKAHTKGAELVATLEHLTAALKVLGAPLEDDDLKAFMASMK